MMPVFSVIVPAYREAPRIERCVKALSAACAETGLAWELIIAVEKCDDDTLALARRAAEDIPQVRVMDLPIQRGKGHAVQAGFLAAQGDIVFFSDADLSADLAALGDFLSVFQTRPDCAGVIGIRTRREGRPPWFRRVLSRVFHRVVRVFTGLPYRDTQCGFKAFRKEQALQLAGQQQEMGYAFDIEWLLFAQRQGWPIVERPLLWRDQPHSHIWLPRDGTKLLWDMLRVRWRFLKR